MKLEDAFQRVINESRLMGKRILFVKNDQVVMVGTVDEVDKDSVKVKTHLIKLPNGKRKEGRWSAELDFNRMQKLKPSDDIENAYEYECDEYEQPTDFVFQDHSDE